jgi:hypothetical protein
MKKSHLPNFNLAAVAVALALGTPGAFANAYNFTFVGGGVTATGNFDETAGVVTGGSILTISGGLGFANFPLSLLLDNDPVPGWSQMNGADSTYLTADNVFTGVDPYLDDNGLDFVNGYIGPSSAGPIYSEEVNIWGNSPGNYTFAEQTGTGNYDLITPSGSLTLTPGGSVPDVPENATVCAALLGLAAFGLLSKRRKQAAV